MEGFEEFLALRGVQRTLINHNSITLDNARHDTRLGLHDRQTRRDPASDLIELLVANSIEQGQDTFDPSEDEDLGSNSSRGEDDVVENILNDNEVQADDNYGLAYETGFERDAIRDGEEGEEDDRMELDPEDGADHTPTYPAPIARPSVFDGQTELFRVADFSNRLESVDESDEESSEDTRGIPLEDDSDDADVFYNTRRESFSTNMDSTNVAAASDAIQSPMSQLGNLDTSFKYTAKPRSNVKFKYPRIHDKTNFIFTPPVKHLNRGSFEAKLKHSGKQLLLKQAPAEKFYNGLKLDAVGTNKLKPIRSTMKYKNNLTCIFSSDNDYLVVAISSDLLIYDFDPITNLPNEKPRLIFDTKPSFTLNSDRVISTWPYFPYGINYVKSCQFLGKTTVCACTDDGRLLVWFVDRFVDQMKQFEPSSERDYFKNLTISPDFKVKLSASLWGLDVKDNIIVASDNSQSVVLLYYHEQDRRFYHTKSHQILHNIPSVSIIKHTGGKVHVACASISGELVIFEFQFKINAGPLNKYDLDFFEHRTMYYTDPIIESMEYGNGDDDIYRRRHPDLHNDVDLVSSARNVFKRLCFNTPVIISRCVVNEDCWTVHSFNRNWFLPVGSLQSVFGDYEIDDAKEDAKIIAESAVLRGKQRLNHRERGANDDYADVTDVTDNQTSLGAAASFQFYKPDTIDFNGVVDPVIRIPPTAKMTNINDEYRRIHKEIVLYEKGHDSTKNDFLVVTTSKKVALFKYPTLYCPCATNPLFNLDLYKKEDSCHSNRLSISAVIPDLSCLIAVSQQGIVTIMRLCSYRGVYGMRQEHVFPHAYRMAGSEDGNYRNIVGLSIRQKKSSVAMGVNNGDCDAVGGDGDGDGGGGGGGSGVGSGGYQMGERNGPLYLLYILYNDGSLLSYNLKEE
ncbi:hypothetical protein CANMA_005433 [Candida margitis]|uniref:uncharacterized protein n=1 Tax=Candida margitis TaxID=1775924 RepID=UPI0022278249|nr:uncharacterized protein CANMA_005433 [Candida margitis]KAI5949853.1 hypothetical protein CANMA_005433 [Candida margitis]